MPTEVVKTLQVSGGDYSTLAGWISYLDTIDWVATDQIPVLEVTGVFSQTGSFYTSTTDATHPITIRAAAGQRTTGQYGTGARFETSNSYGGILGFYSCHARVEGLELINTGSYSKAITGSGAVSVASLRIIGCYLRGAAIGGGACDRTDVATFISCRADQCGVGYRYNNKAYHCISTNCGIGFESSQYASLYLDSVNCVSYNDSTSWDLVSEYDSNSHHNASSQYSTAGVPGANGYASNVVSGDFEDAAGGDFSLSSGSSLAGIGADLSGILGADWVDVNGDPYSATSPPIGFFQPATGAGAVTGSLAVTEASTDTLSAAGQVVVSATLAVTEGASDTASISGGVVVSGTLDVSESAADTLAASATVAWPAVSGSLDVSEGASDTAAFSGSITAGVAGQLAVVEPAADTLVATGAVAVQGDLNADEVSADTFAATGTAANAGVSGILAASESAADTLAGTGQVSIDGTLDASEGASDTAAFAGQVPISGALAVTEPGTDTAVFNGTNTVIGALSVTEGATDTLAATGELAVAITGDLAAAETRRDVLRAAGLTGVVSACPACLSWKITSAHLSFERTGCTDLTFTRGC